MMIDRHLALVAVLTLLPSFVGAAPLAAAPSDQQQQVGEAAAGADDPVLETQVREIAAQLRCPTCRALSVLDSPSGMAQEMRGLIREQLRSGKTPEQVTAYFVERYGEWILLKPKARGFNWTVWLLPFVVLGGGLVFVLLTARRWVQQGEARAAALTEEVGEREP